MKSGDKFSHDLPLPDYQKSHYQQAPNPIVEIKPIQRKILSVTFILNRAFSKAANYVFLREIIQSWVTSPEGQQQ